MSLNLSVAAETLINDVVVDEHVRPKLRTSPIGTSCPNPSLSEKTCGNFNTDAAAPLDVNHSNLVKTSPKHLDHVFTKMIPAIEANNIDEFHLSRILDRQVSCCFHTISGVA